MNILLIGNGFDLVHTLPTTYLDFFDFAQKVFALYRGVSYKWEEYERNLLNKWNYSKEMTDYIKNIFFEKDKNKVANSLVNLLSNNIWYEYFIKINKNNKEVNKTWIDFESEISQVLKLLSIDGKEYTLYKPNEVFLKQVSNDKTDEVPSTINYINDVLLRKYENNIKKNYTCLDYVIDLESDLKRLTKALEIYLHEVVEYVYIKNKALYNGSIKNISSDIMNLDIDKLLSFNYTHTFEKLYQHKKIDIHYIHGETHSLTDNLNSDIENCNLVLGIDEYLTGENKSKKNLLIFFRKYFQRIYKGTGSVYKNWINEIKNSTDNIHNLYIFGHSLDTTDKDVLKELIITPKIITTIFYHSKIALKSQINNLVEVLGQEQLIDMVYATKPSIIFKEQKTLISLDSSGLQAKTAIYQLTFSNVAYKDYILSNFRNHNSRYFFNIETLLQLTYLLFNEIAIDDVILILQDIGGSNYRSEITPIIHKYNFGGLGLDFINKLLNA